MDNIKIFTAFHKEFQIPNDEYHIPVHVWKELSDIKLPFLCDNIWDNISIKNPNYCELTMLYWIWKNYDLSNIDYIGLAHYRRLFDIRHIERIHNYDIICPKKSWSSMGSLFVSIERQYKQAHIPEDFDLMRNVLYSLYPDYKKYDYIFSEFHIFFMRAYFFNMFILKKEIFFDYCNWLFSVLFEIEKKIQISIYPYQARVFWFMWERLFNIYVEKKKCEGYKIIEKKLFFIK